ncbi:hypothetical protein [Bradyrhizobium sp. NAS80.1]|uniref:hypothetical protein n=1 Tax=Bradyrhizobium sp. NAS80.1 TaxID=1680159 RepID=UPI001FD8DA53|nr:hypothetical protein [Bradyrhizobium sp. NAS80.1]
MTLGSGTSLVVLLLLFVIPLLDKNARRPVEQLELKVIFNLPDQKADNRFRIESALNERALGAEVTEYQGQLSERAGRPGGDGTWFVGSLGAGSSGGGRGGMAAGTFVDLGRRYPPLRARERIFDLPSCGHM